MISATMTINYNDGSEYDYEIHTESLDMLLSQINDLVRLESQHHSCTSVVITISGLGRVR